MGLGLALVSEIGMHEMTEDISFVLERGNLGLMMNW
jgi:hypothetical protein